MHSALNCLLVGVVASCVVGFSPRSLATAPAAEAPHTASAQGIDLAERLAAGKLRIVNRDATKGEGRPGAIHVSPRQGDGMVWIEGSDFGEGTIEVDIRGKDVLQQSFAGVAFRGKDDKTYECVYLRPFNFRAEDPVRRQ